MDTGPNTIYVPCRLSEERVVSSIILGSGNPLLGLEASQPFPMVRVISVSWAAAS